MDTSPNLGLPYIAAAQAQKHVTHNEAIRELDAIVHLAVLDRGLSTPPATPSHGDRYIVAAGGTGAWTGNDGKIAAYQDGAWMFYEPKEGWVAWIADESTLCAWDGAAWGAVGGSGAGGVNPVPLVGVNTTADTTNRLAVKSDATLFSHDDVTPGSGDMRQKLNKAAAGNTVSQLYQTNFSGRAETGLTGDDNFHVKVSADGSAWHEAIVVDRTTGAVSMPNTSIGGASGPVYNPFLPRAWAKIGELAVRKANERLTLFGIGDRISPAIFNTLFPRLKIEHGKGGTAGSLIGSNQWLEHGSGTAVEMKHPSQGGAGVTADADAYSKSPIGAYWKFATGTAKYWGIGAGDGDTPLPIEFAKAFASPRTMTRLGLYYLRQPGGGTMKMQIARGYTPTLFDVPGLTAIDTSGTLGIQYVETAFPAWSAGATYAVGAWVIYGEQAWRCQTATTAGQSPDTTPASWLEMASAWRIQLTHTGVGGDAFVLGALVGATRGVIGHNWGFGGLSMNSAVASPRLAELTALVKPDIVVARYIDRPGDGIGIDNSGYTPAQMAAHAMQGLRDAFPATIVPVDPSPWGGAGNFTAKKPHFLWFGPHNVNYLYDGASQSVAMKANALAAGDCYVDTIAMMGAWQTAWDMGLMGSGDGGPSTSVHQRYIFDAALVTAVLRETGLIGGALIKPLADPRHETLVVGPNTAATWGQLGFVNKANRVKFGNASINVSFAPGDDATYTGIAGKIYSADGGFGAAFLFDSTGAANGYRHLMGSQNGAGFFIKMDGQQEFLRHNGSQFFLGYNAHYTPMYIGRRCTALTGIMHGNVALVAGAATVTNAQLTANANIVVTRRVRGGTVGATYEVTPAAGSFTITARSAADATATGDTSTLSYVVIEP